MANRLTLLLLLTGAACSTEGPAGTNGETAGTLGTAGASSLSGGSSGLGGATGGALSAGTPAIAGATPGGSAGESASGGSSGSAPEAGAGAQAAGGRDTSDSDALIVPRGVNVIAKEGGAGVFEMTALTLRRGTQGTELYAAVKNTGAQHACSAALSAELFDKDGLSLGSGIGSLLPKRFYRIEDEVAAGAIGACLGPGEVSVASVDGLPAEVVLEDVTDVVYWAQYFAFDATPIEGLRVESVEYVTNDAGTIYKGALVNGFDVPVTNPFVSIFPMNRVGRPLGIATSTDTRELAPGEGWTFETTSVPEPGHTEIAFATGGLPN